MNPEFLKILRCPACKKQLTEQKSSLVCTSCNNALPIIGGIAVFLSQKQLSDFFNQESLGKYLSEASKIKGIIAKSENFIEGLKEIVAVVNMNDFQKKYAEETCQWEDDLNNPEAERANKRTTEIIAEKARITDARTILDWPSGKGCFLRTILDKVRQNTLIVCLDIDFVELASLKAFLQRGSKEQKILFVNADARQMPFNAEVFDAVTAWGGFIEVPDAPKAIAESFRVLAKNGCFAGDGEVYKENSESMKIAEKLRIDSLVSKEKIEKCLIDVEFKNIFLESVFEGYDKDNLRDDERAPLPARGDWFGLVVAGGQK